MKLPLLTSKKTKNFIYIFLIQLLFFNLKNCQSCNEKNHLVDAANEILRNYFSIDVSFIHINEKINIMYNPMVTAELTFKNGVEYSASNKKFEIKNKITYDIHTNEVDFKNVYGVNFNDALSIDFDNKGISINQRILKSCKNVDCTVAVNFYLDYYEIVYSIKTKNDNSYILGELKITIKPTSIPKQNYYKKVYIKAPSLEKVEVAFKKLSYGVILASAATITYKAAIVIDKVLYVARLLQPII